MQGFLKIGRNYRQKKQERLQKAQNAWLQCPPMLLQPVATDQALQRVQETHHWQQRRVISKVSVNAEQLDQQQREQTGKKVAAP